MMQTIVFKGIRPECRTIREKIFMQEQGFSHEFDERDADAWHALVFDGDNAVGTARLYREGDGFFVGRFAILADYRGRGLGRVMMRELMDKAVELGAADLTLFAQVRAAAFYERLGFERTKEISYDEGVAHVKMIYPFARPNTEKKSLLFINACIRKEESRTLRLARAYLEEIEDRFEVDEIVLDAKPVHPLHSGSLSERSEKLASGNTASVMFAQARRLAAADRILIAAPFWDMSFPALLKCYIESVCIDGITFRATDDGSAGLCKARSLTYLTTRGFNIPDGSEMEQAYGYLRAITRFWGIPRFDAVSAYGLDLCAPDVLESRLNAACAQARAKARIK